MSRDNESIDGNAEFKVVKESPFKFVLSCKSDQVRIRNIPPLEPPINSDDASSMYHDEVARAFSEAGFTNIREEEVRDLPLSERDRNWYTEHVTISGGSDFEEADVFLADEEVVITYHVLADITPPDNSSALEGMDHEEVAEQFKDAGFTNVQEVEVDGNGEKGAVESILIGGWLGTEDFSKSDKFAFDTSVEIKYSNGEGSSAYSIDSSSSEVLTVETSSDLSKLLSSSSTNAGWFCMKYQGQTIRFDGYVADLALNEDYNTRWNVLILSGDNGASPSLGSNFRLSDVGMYEMNVLNSDTLRTGDNITITAVVGSYNATSDWLELDPVSISVR